MIALYNFLEAKETDFSERGFNKVPNIYGFREIDEKEVYTYLKSLEKNYFYFLEKRYKDYFKESDLDKKELKYFNELLKKGIIYKKNDLFFIPLEVVLVMKKIRSLRSSLFFLVMNTNYQSIDIILKNLYDIGIIKNLDFSSYSLLTKKAFLVESIFKNLDFIKSKCLEAYKEIRSKFKSFGYPVDKYEVFADNFLDYSFGNNIYNYYNMKDFRGIEKTYLLKTFFYGIFYFFENRIHFPIEFYLIEKKEALKTNKKTELRQFSIEDFSYTVKRIFSYFVFGESKITNDFLLSKITFSKIAKLIPEKNDQEIYFFTNIVLNFLFSESNTDSKADFFSSLNLKNANIENIIDCFYGDYVGIEMYKDSSKGSINYNNKSFFNAFIKEISFEIENLDSEEKNFGDFFADFTERCPNIVGGFYNMLSYLQTYNCGYESFEDLFDFTEKMLLNFYKIGIISIRFDENQKILSIKQNIKDENFSNKLIKPFFPNIAKKNKNIVSIESNNEIIINTDDICQDLYILKEFGELKELKDNIIIQISKPKMLQFMEKGNSKDFILSKLKEISKYELPQVLIYLLNDLEEKTGEIKIFPCFGVIKAASPILIKELLNQNFLNEYAFDIGDGNIYIKDNGESLEKISKLIKKKGYSCIVKD